MKNLHTAIIAVMKKVKTLKKDTDVNGRYKAISDNKTRKVLLGAMAEHGLTIAPVDVELHESVQTSKSGNAQNMVTAVMSYQITHAPSGESIVIKSIGSGLDSQDKAPGKAMTYAQKYALLNLFMIPTGNEEDRVVKELTAAEKPILSIHSDKWPLAVEMLAKGETTTSRIRNKWQLSAKDEKELLTQVEIYKEHAK